MTSAEPSSTSTPPSTDVFTDARAEQVIGSARRVADDVTAGTPADRGHRIPHGHPDELVARVHPLLAR